MTATRAMLCLLLAIAASLVAVPSSAQGGTYTFTETFDDLDFAESPASKPQYTYSFGGTGSAIGVTTPAQGAASLRLQSSSVNARANFVTTTDICADGGIRFQFRASTLPAAGEMFQLGISPGDAWFSWSTANNVYAVVQIQSSGNVILQQEWVGSTANGETLDGLGLTITPGTWYDFQILCPAPSTSGTTTLIEHTTGSVVQRSVTRPGNWLTYFTAKTQATGQPFVYLDNLRFNAAAALPTIASEASLTGLSGVVGFAVDDTGATAIFRTDAGDWVRVYGAGTLAAPSSVETDCTATGGVAAMASHVAYFHCELNDDDEYTPYQLHIRSPSLNDPALPGACTEGHAGSFCKQDIPLRNHVFEEDADGDQDDDTYIAVLEEVPIDFSTIRTSGFNRALTALAFADQTGALGVWTYTHLNDNPDSSAITAVGISNQSPDQICVHRDDHGATYLYGSSTQSNVRGFRVTFTEQGPEEYKLVPHMAQVFVGTGSTAGARGVACGEDRLAILNGDKVTLWNRTAAGQSDAPHCTITGLTGPTNVPAGGIAMSYDGLWFAYVDGTTWTAANAITCQKVSTGTIPAGAFRGIATTGCGGNLWVATQTGGARYPIWTTTVETDCIFNPVIDPADIDGDGIPNNQDPDIDGDGIHNDTDTDDDGDGIPDTLDSSPGGNEATPAEGDEFWWICQSTGCEIGWGFAFLAIPAFLAWLISGGLRRNRWGEWQASSGNPVIIGLFTIFGLMGSWFVNAFFVIVTVVLVVGGGVLIWLKIGRAASGGGE